jgi:hypothetical protein
VTQLCVLEQRHVIRFLLKDGVAPKGIPARLSEVYEEEAMKKTQVFYWAKEIRRWRESLSDEPRPGRPPEIGLHMILALGWKWIHTPRQEKSPIPWPFPHKL